ncbi:myosin heavy chain, clone 203-like [Montipora foliosa]|uniref:myosin heavy chain, clone 203-like n=1 Tax=Montipora foliosa TaxID=591990 RepID=UPI0035F15E08
MADQAESTKRKTRQSSSTSSAEENRLPDDKKIRRYTSFSDSETSNVSDEVTTALNMADLVTPKLELLLEKLVTVESKLEKVEEYVKAVDDKVSSLQAKMDGFESFKRETEKKVLELDEGLIFANAERESFKAELQDLHNQVNQLKDEKLYMEVYNRRENLRFFGIEEEAVQKDTKEVLVNFLTKELGIEGASDMEFQRVHRLGKQNASSGKPRQIIARFLRYPDREEVTANARKLKGKNYGISADLPKEIMERRRKKMQRFKKAKGEGKTAYVSRSEPDKLFIDGVEV